jgi:cell division protein FtsQ
VGLLAVLGGLTFSALVLKNYLGRDSRFRIDGAGNIAATGLSEVSRAEMLPVFGEDIGRNIFFVPLAERRRQLEQIPWVERATVMRFLPDQLRVSVVERQPVAFVRQGQQIGLVDASGVLLTMPPAMMAQHHYSFPVVTGIDAHDAAVARKGRMAVYGRLLAELDANGQHLSEQISEIDLTDPEDARVMMPEQGGDILAHFGEDHFLERYERYKTHVAEWRQQYPKLAAVDLRYDQQVVLEMTPGSSATPVTPILQSAAGSAATKPAAAPAKAEAAAPAKAAPAKKDRAQADAKPSPAAPVKKDRAQVENKPSPAVKDSPTSKPTKAEPAKTQRKPAARPKATTVKDKKKRADAPPKKTAALTVNKTKPAAKPHPGTAAGQGQ